MRGRDSPANQEVLAIGNSAEGSIRSTRDAGAIEIRRHVRELGPLEFDDGIRVACLQGIVRDVAEVWVRPRPHHHAVLGGREHFDCLRRRIVTDNFRVHTVDEIDVLANVPREDHREGRRRGREPARASCREPATAGALAGGPEAVVLHKRGLRKLSAKGAYGTFWLRGRHLTGGFYSPS